MILYGTVNILIDEHVIESIDILVAQTINRKEPLNFFIEIISNYNTLLKSAFSLH